MLTFTTTNQPQTLSPPTNTLSYWFIHFLMSLHAHTHTHTHTRTFRCAAGYLFLPHTEKYFSSSSHFLFFSYFSHQTPSCTNSLACTAGNTTKPQATGLTR